jgi:hypothetical protein
MQWNCKEATSQQGPEPLSTETEISTVLGAVARQQQVKTNREDLMRVVVNCKKCELAIAL